MLQRLARHTSTAATQRRPHLGCGPGDPSRPPKRTHWTSRHIGHRQSHAHVDIEGNGCVPPRDPWPGPRPTTLKPDLVSKRRTETARDAQNRCHGKLGGDTKCLSRVRARREHFGTSLPRHGVASEDDRASDGRATGAQRRRRRRLGRLLRHGFAPMDAGRAF